MTPGGRNEKPELLLCFMGFHGAFVRLGFVPLGLDHFKVSDLYP